MSNTGEFFYRVRCEYNEICKSSRYYCNTCLRNKANKYKDNFSLDGRVKGEWDIINDYNNIFERKNYNNGK